jgi:HEPN domain-containing protein
MRTEEMARDYLTRAAMTLEEARTAAAKGIYSLAVRRAQKTVELSLKAALRFLAIEYPREHDVCKRGLTQGERDETAPRMVQRQIRIPDARVK